MLDLGFLLVYLQSSHKTFRIKQKLAKAFKMNRPIPQWVRLQTGNKIRFVDCLFHPIQHSFQATNDLGMQGALC